MPVADVLLNAAQDSDHAAIDMANTWSHGQRSQLGASDNPGTSNLHMGERLLGKWPTMFTSKTFPHAMASLRKITLRSCAYAGDNR